MKAVEEERLWSRLLAAPGVGLPVDVHAESGSITIDRRCVVVAGLNGAGKSRLLQAASEQLAGRSRLIRLHEECESTLSILRSRVDIAEMEEESGTLEVQGLELAWLKRVVGRDYASVTRAELEMIPSDGELGEELIVPNFSVSLYGDDFSGVQMGLGEFAIHLLFWRLSRFDDLPAGSFLVLDEPDAYLPPKGRVALLRYLLDTAIRRQLNLIISTHSETLIEEALANDSLVLLVRDASGSHSTLATRGDRALAAPLLSPRQVRLILFVEDEVAAALLRALLRRAGRDPDVWHVAWVRGEGDLRELATRLPAEAGMPFGVVLVFDGDIDASDTASRSRWPVMALPGGAAPDRLLMEVADDPEALAQALGLGVATLRLLLADIAGKDHHDWINELCAACPSRVVALQAIADLWVATNEDLALQFEAEVAAAIATRGWE